MNGRFAITLFSVTSQRFENAMRQPRSVSQAGQLLRNLRMEQDDANVFDPVVRDGERTVAQWHFKPAHCRIVPSSIPRRYGNHAYRRLENFVAASQFNSTNTNRRPLMSESFPLPTEPEGVIPSLLKRFNSGKIEAMMALYAPEAVFVANDGRTITDRAEFMAILEHDIKLGLPLKANVRHVFVGGDTAQIVLDWSIDGTGPDGKIVHMHGTASDIMRRGADGFWRYIIDNNQGTAVRQPG